MIFFWKNHKSISYLPIPQPADSLCIRMVAWPGRFFECFTQI